MPDNIKKHAKNLLKPYLRSSCAAEIIESARVLARIALESKEMRPQHRRKMLNDAIWYCTEVDGKWKTRYKSMEVLYLAKNDPASLVLINHEHVVTRKELVDKMWAEQENLLENLPELNRLLDSAVACIVTASEHAKLAGGSGWSRYANVVVYDTEKVPPEIVEIGRFKPMDM